MRSARLLAGVFRNPDLRRIELAFVGFNAAEWGVWIALLIYAYERGGATTAGVVAVVQLIPAAIFAPLAASFCERHSPTRVLGVGYFAQTGAMAATAVVLLADGPAAAAYALAAVAATAVTVARPAQAVLLPSLARTPEELTAANVVSGWIESVAVLGAPAVAGILFSAGGAGTVFAVMAGCTLVSAVLVGPVRRPAGQEGGTAVAGALDGLRVVAHEPGPRSLVWLLAVEAVALGALDVLYVVLAVGILHHGGGTAGYLNAAFGAGGVAGVAVTVALVGRRRLAPALLGALALWSLSLALIAVAPSLLSAFGLLAAAGVGRTLVDVAGRTLLQRTARPEVLARVFGLLEGVMMAGFAVGAITASAFVALAGNRGAFVCFAVLLPTCAVLVLRGLLGADAVALPVVELARLRALPIFAPLDPATLEGLARCLEPVELAAGVPVVREGERGDCFYVVAEGELDVTVGGEQVSTLERGDCFGEIALLREVPRTATVTSRTPVRLDSLDSASFVTAVTGHDPSAHAAGKLIRDRLERATSPS
jgi:Cyclic nucleotide-binding domain/Major Facilitator Superfamily